MAEVPSRPTVALDSRLAGSRRTSAITLTLPTEMKKLVTGI
jgi:hypothetical protein